MEKAVNGRWLVTEKRKVEQVEDLEVYQAFFALAVDVEKATKLWNSDFRWLRSQMLRSSESVCANLTEGFYSQYSTEYLLSLYRCRREARETVTHLRYAMQVDALSNKIDTELLDRYGEALRQLGKLISSIERKIEMRGKGRVAPGLPRPPTTNH
jgi:four helix bundle protein